MLKKTILTLSVTSFLMVSIVSKPVYASGNDLLGTLLGAAGGAAVGSNLGKGKGRTVAIAVGTLLGAGVGSNLSRSHDYTDRSYRQHKPYGYHKRYGHNKNYGHYKRYGHNKHYGYHKNYGSSHHSYYSSSNYYANPVYSQPANIGNYYTSSSVSQATVTQPEPYCREYIQTVNVGGKIQESYGTACQQQDGAWKIQQ